MVRGAMSTLPLPLPSLCLPLPSLPVHMQGMCVVGVSALGPMTTIVSDVLGVWQPYSVSLSVIDRGSSAHSLTVIRIRHVYSLLRFANARRPVVRSRPSRAQLTATSFGVFRSPEREADEGLPAGPIPQGLTGGVPGHSFLGITEWPRRRTCSRNDAS